MNYITSFQHQQVSFDLGSDWHLPFIKLSNIYNKFPDLIKEQKKSDILILAGDVFESLSGFDPSSHICYLLKQFALFYKIVLFVPGNHDLRGRKNPWYAFRDHLRIQEIIHNVFTPSYAVDPEIINLQEIDDSFPSMNIMLANLFYDMNFIDPAIFDWSQQNIHAFYSKTDDGRFFLEGETQTFKHMSKLVRSDLTQEIDMLITHTLPHPSLVSFRVANKDLSILEKEQQLGINFICDLDYDRQEAEKRKLTSEEFRSYWNHKSFFMGSDVLSKTSFKDGLACIYGHNHKSNNSISYINNKQVRFISYQPGGVHEF